MTTAQQILKRSTRQPIRRLYMKRIQDDGAYESDWFNISPYVSSWGIPTEAFGDQVFLGAYEVDAWTIALNNRTRKFQETTDFNSFFFGFKTRFKTRFKITYSFVDPESPTTEILVRSWYGIMFSTPRNTGSSIIYYNIASVLKVFQIYPASGISTANGTTADLIDRLVKKDVNSVRLFDQFLEGANDSERYSINPDALSVTTCSSVAVGDGRTVWDKMKTYSLIDDFFPYIDDTGNFVWDSKTETAAIQWKFNGGGAFDNDYGINIISADEEYIDWNNIWNRVVLTYDTNGNSETADETWTPGDGSTQDIFGERTFESDIIDLDSSTAATVAAAIQSEYKPAKKMLAFAAKLTPNLKPKDKVEINFTGEVIYKNAFKIGISLLGGTDVLSGRSGSINLSGFEAKIVYAAHDLDKLFSAFIVREV